MIKYLRPKQEYVDRYERLTVWDCRRTENFHKDYKNEELSKEAPNSVKVVNEIALHYDLLFTTLYWYDNKERKIQEWMDEDTEKDRLLETAQAPQGIRCLKCRSSVTPNDRILHDWGGEKKNRVLFMYDCPNGCMPHRAFFNDGEEYRVKPNPCPKCQAEMTKISEKVENEKVITTSTCPKCKYVETDEFDLKIKEEPPDPDYEKDRARFCLSEEAAKKNQEEKFQLEGIAQFMEDWKKKDEKKEEYEKIAKLKKLTVFDLEKLLTPVLKKEGYVKLQFGNPEMGKDVFMSFTAQDSRSDRIERESSIKLQKILKTTLSDTNWRLMSEGASYRLGILSGRLRAYEREEDLLSLVKDR